MVDIKHPYHHPLILPTLHLALALSDCATPKPHYSVVNVVGTLASIVVKYPVSLLSKAVYLKNDSQMQMYHAQGVEQHSFSCSFVGGIIDIIVIRISREVGCRCLKQTWFV